MRPRGCTTCSALFLATLYACTFISFSSASQTCTSCICQLNNEFARSIPLAQAGNWHRFSYSFTGFCTDQPSLVTLQEYWLDSRNGNDLNNGSREAPFATMVALNGPAMKASSVNFQVYVSPGIYPVTHFRYTEANNWTFSACLDCPRDSQTNGQVVFAPIPRCDATGIRGVFEEDSLSPISTSLRLNFRDITFRPHTTDHFLDPASNCKGSFLNHVFYVKWHGASFERCQIRNFVLRNSALSHFAHSPTLVSATAGALIFINSTIVDNKLVQDETGMQYQELAGFYGEIDGDEARLEIRNCIFNSTQLEAELIDGGLFRCLRTCVVLGSIFHGNEGIVGSEGSGLLFQVKGPLARLHVDNSIFSENIFLPLRDPSPRSGFFAKVGTEQGSWFKSARLSSLSSSTPDSPSRRSHSKSSNIVIDSSDSDEPTQDFGVTSGAVISAFVSDFDEIVVSNSLFVSNLAVQGACIAVITATVPAIPNSQSNNVKVTGSRFVFNSVSSGVGAVAYILGGGTTFVALSDLKFDSNYAPTLGFFEFPGSKQLLGASIEPHLVSIFRTPKLTMSGITFSDIAKGHNISNPFVHLVICWLPGVVVVSDVEWTKIAPAPSVTLLHIHSATSAATISNIILHNPDHRIISNFQITVVRLSSDQDSAYAFSSAQHLMNNISIISWDRGESVTIISASDVSRLKVDNLTSYDINSAVKPIFSASGITRSLILRNWNISGFSAPIILSSIIDLQIENVYVSSYTSTTPIFEMEGLGGDSTIRELHCSLSMGPFMVISTPATVILSDSSFTEAVIDEGDDAPVSFTGDGTLEVRNCSFYLNEAPAAGALSIRRAMLRVFNSTFDSNIGNLDGGAINARNCPYLEVDSSSFSLNLANKAGGAIHSQCFATSISNSGFTNNVGGDGGALSSYTSSFFFINSCIFLENYSNYIGGAVHVGHEAGDKDPIFEITGCLFQSNQAWASKLVNDPLEWTPGGEDMSLGGALFTDSKVKITDTEFRNNLATHGGAVMLADTSGFFTDGSTLSWRNVTFASNIGHLGGALNCLYDYDKTLSDPSVPSQDVVWSVFFDKATFVNNQAAAGGAIAALSMRPDLPSSNVTNSIFLGNTAQYGAAIFVDYSNYVPIISGQTFENQSAFVAGGTLFISEINMDLMAARSSMEQFRMDNSFKSNVANGWGPFMATIKPILFSSNPSNDTSTSPVSSVSFHKTSRSSVDTKDGLQQLDEFSETTGFLLDLDALFSSQSSRRRPASSTVPTASPSNPTPSFQTSQRLISFYPGISQAIAIRVSDQFGQDTPNQKKGFFSLTTQLIDCSWPSGCEDLVFKIERREGQLGEHWEVLDMYFRAPSMPTVTIDATLILKVTIHPISILPTNWATLYIPVKLKPCGAGLGVDKDNPAICSPCLLTTFGFNGQCSSCTHDSRVQCFGDSFTTVGGYWVQTKRDTNEFGVVSCNPGWCPGGVENPCLSTREGILCGSCIKGLSESIISSCIDCNGPNWPMILIALLGLWAASLVLHTLVAVSSGKSTILIFFVQTTFTITYQLSFMDAIAALDKRKTSRSNLPPPLQWALCFFPMDHLTRSLFIALIPFVMMILISFTFLLQRILFLCLKGLRLSSGGDEPQIGLSDVDSEAEPLLLDDGSGDVRIIEEGDGFGMRDVGASVRLKSVLTRSTVDSESNARYSLARTSIQTASTIDGETFYSKRTIGFELSDSDEEEGSSTEAHDYEAVPQDDSEQPRKSLGHSHKYDEIVKTRYGSDYGETEVKLVSMTMEHEGYDSDAYLSTDSASPDKPSIKLVDVNLGPVEKQDAATYQDIYTWQTETAFFHRYRLIRTVLSLFATSFTSILGAVMSTVGCVTLYDGSQVLLAAPSVSCESYRFRYWRYLYILFLPYLAAVLATILGKLIYSYRKNQLSRTDVRFGVWYEMYKPKLFAWKVTEFVRRFCLSIAGNLFLADPLARASVLAVLLVIFLLIQLLAMPYKQRLENRLEALSLFSLTFISLIVLWQSRERSTSNIPALLAWTLAVLVAATIAAAFTIKKLHTLAVWRR